MGRAQQQVSHACLLEHVSVYVWLPEETEREREGERVREERDGGREGWREREGGREREMASVSVYRHGEKGA